MIIVVDPGIREESLGRDEFVNPVARIVERCGHTWKYQHYASMQDHEWTHASGIIICGTALKDNGFLEHLEHFSWLRDCEIPVLGICAGMQVLCMIFGGSIIPGCEIGMTDVKVTSPHPFMPKSSSFKAYQLHSHSCLPPPGWERLAESAMCIQAVRDPKRPFFGVMFHPEVRNDRVIEVFLESCNG